MSVIIPAIIAKDAQELKQKLSQVEGLVSRAQIDVMDGVFVPSTSWRTPTDLEHIKCAVNLEAHFMVSAPEHIIDEWLHSPVKRFLIHYESTTHEAVKGLLANIIRAGKQAGVVLKMETPLFVLDELLSDTACRPSVVQLMGIREIGYYGHALDETVYNRITALYERHPDITIEVDGGVNLENAKRLVQAGASFLVVGSAIFKSDDIAQTIARFTKEVSEV